MCETAKVEECGVPPGTQRTAARQDYVLLPRSPPYCDTVPETPPTRFKPAALNQGPSH
eukprot:COSAG02_NODE_36128_length_458_cov_1.401114_1_plen_57_part_01